MQHYFYKKFKNKPTAELKTIIQLTDMYTEPAINAAIQLLNERPEERDEAVERAIDEAVQHQEKKKQKEPEPVNDPLLTIFTRRILAFLIDMIVLSGLSFVIGYLLMYTPYVREPWEPILSFLLFLAYFSIFNSKVGKTTLGKYVTGIRVLDQNKLPLTWGKAVIRYALLFAPYFIIRALDQASISFLGIVFGLKVTYWLAIFFFMAADKPLRRSYHDLLTGSFLYDKSLEPEASNFPKKYVKLFALVGAGSVLFFFSFNMVKNRRFNTTSSTATNTSVNTQMDHFAPVFSQDMSGVNDLFSSIDGMEDKLSEVGFSFVQDDREKYLKIELRPKVYPFDESLSDEIYQNIQGGGIRLTRLDKVEIIQRAGFNMTLARFNKSLTKTYRP